MSSRVRRVAFEVGRVIAVVGLAVVGSTVVGFQSSAQAEEEAAAAKLQIRNYDHLEFDTVTGTYFGVATFYTQDDTVGFRSQPTATGGVFTGETDNEAFTGEIRLLMGGETFQAGVAIPYHATGGDALGGGKDNVGDVRAHIKMVPLRKELFDLGGGLMLTFPGGGESDGISTGNIGVLPFVTGTGHLGPADLNGHIGYNIINHDDPNGSPESILYGSSLKYPLLDILGLRLELVGQQFTSGEDRNVVAIQPGLDVLIECGPIDLQLGAAGSYGLSGGTAGSDNSYNSRWGLNTISGLSRGEWGGGISLGVLWN